MKPLPLRLFLVSLLLVPAGCSSAARSRIPAPSFSPSAAASAALAEYDTNKDGYLDAKELEQCPALQDTLKRLHKESSGRLSADDIANELRSIVDSKVGLMTIPCRVTLNGTPLAGARVTFTPEKFLGDAIKPAAGTSDPDGRVVLQVEGMDLPGLPPGLYRVTVSKKDAQGRELIPARYNTQTTLGYEIGPNMRGGVALALKP